MGNIVPSVTRNLLINITNTMRLFLLSLVVLLTVVSSQAGDYYDDYYDSHEHHESQEHHDSHEHHDDDYHDENEKHNDDYHDDHDHNDHHHEDYDYVHHKDDKSSKQKRFPPEGPPHPQACKDKLPNCASLKSDCMVRG